MDEVDDSQVLCQGITQGRGAELPRLHGPQRLCGPWLRGHRALGTELLEPTLAGAERNRRDETRFALDASGAHPREGGCIFFPLVTKLDRIVEGEYS